MATQTPSIPEGQLPGRMQQTPAARGRASSSTSREGQSTSFSQAGGTPAVLQTTGRTPAGPQAVQAQAVPQAVQAQAVPQTGQAQTAPRAGQAQVVPQAGQAQAAPQVQQAPAAPQGQQPPPAPVQGLPPVVVQGQGPIQQVVDIQLEFSLLRQQIERLQGRSIEGIKDEILQLAARPLPAFDQNRAVALLETLASQAQMQAHPKAEEFRYILQQVRPLAHLPRFKDILQDLLGPPILKQINKSITGCFKDIAVVPQFAFPQAATGAPGAGDGTPFGQQGYPQYSQPQVQNQARY